MKRILAFVLAALLALSACSTMAEEIVEETVAEPFEPMVEEVEVVLGDEETILGDEETILGDEETILGDEDPEESRTIDAQFAADEAVLTVNGVSYGEATLQESFQAEDEAGNPLHWFWDAEESRLHLHGNAFSRRFDITYTGETLKLWLANGSVVENLTAKDVELGGDGNINGLGTVNVRNMRITRGSFYDINCGNIALAGMEPNWNRDYSGIPGMRFRSLELEKAFLTCVNPVIEDTLTILDFDTGMVDYYYSFYVAGTLSAGQVEIRGSLLKASDGIICGGFNQVGGQVTADYIHAEHTISATGGKLYVSNDDPSIEAIRADRLALGGTLTAELEDDSHLLNVNTLDVNGLRDTDDVSTVLLMNNGRYRRLGNDLSAALVIGGDAFTQNELDSEDLSGDGWRWDHQNKQLILCGYTGDDIASDKALSIYIQGGSNNSFGDLVLAHGGTISGDGAITCSVSSVGDVAVRDCDWSGSAMVVGSIRLDNVYGGATLYTEGDIAIENCRLAGGKAVMADGDLNITGSLVEASDAHDEESGFLATGKVTVKNSLLLCSYLYGENAIDKNTAVFIYSGDSGFTLWKSATLKKSFNLPEVYSYTIPKKLALTITKGCALSHRGRIFKYGKIKGTVIDLEDYPGDVVITGSHEMVVGSTQKLVLRYLSGESIVHMEWRSSAPELVSVNREGQVTVNRAAAGHIGETVTLTGRANNYASATFDITIAPGTEEIAIKRDGAAPLELWLDPANQSAKLDAEVTPANAPKNVAWKTADARIATADADGTIKAVKAGTTTVWAEATDGTGIKSPKLAVKVLGAPKSVKAEKKLSLSYDYIEGVGTSASLDVALPAGTASTLQYSGYDNSVVTVSGDGLVTAVGPGKTKVTVKTFNGKKAVCEVTVADAAYPTGLMLDHSGTVEIGLDETLQLVATLEPVGTAQSEIHWKSSSIGVATVDANGIVTPIKTGKVTVTATAAKNKKAKAVVKIIIRDAPKH